jgi:hypothetical protein
MATFLILSCTDMVFNSSCGISENFLKFLKKCDEKVRECDETRSPTPILLDSF